MWFADVALPLSWTVLTGWLLITVFAARVTAVRAALPHPRLWLAGSGVASALFAGQALIVDRVEDLAAPGPLDRSLLGWAVAHRSPAATGAMKAVSTLGSTTTMAILAVLGAALLWRLHHRALAGVVLTAAAGAGALVQGFKLLYQRARPPVVDRLIAEPSFSLPSGHALGSIVVLGVLAAVVVILVPQRGARVTAITLAVLGTGTIGVSRIYLGVHWTSDVLVGWLLGGAWLAACLTALALLTARPACSTRPPSPGRPSGRRGRPTSALLRRDSTRTTRTAAPSPPRLCDAACWWAPLGVQPITSSTGWADGP